MAAESNAETLGFQTEVKQLLKLVINSLYSNKEIFLRELISNASDACDKLRFEALSDSQLTADDPNLQVEVSFNKEARTITVSDNGIGMSRQEVIDNIGTIAKSGTRQFFGALTGDQAKDAQLIGQFGVGFYSAFVVANEVKLITRRAGADADQAVRWASSGEGDYTLETISRNQRGTEIILHLRDDQDDLLDEWRLKSIITKYSDHISLPVMMQVSKPGDDEDAPPTTEIEQINKASALWTRSKKEISDDEYNALYKHISHDYEDPLICNHSQVEGRLEYTSLLYIPTRAPFDLWDRDSRHGLKLYVQRVFIMDDAEHLLPRYLRFVRGVIDSNDLPLNVSREILQSNKIIDSMRAGSTKKILTLLETLATEDEEKYAHFWDQFGLTIKEGPTEDFTNREQLAKLMRFASTHADDEKQNVSLADYVSRMKEGQEKIYYLTGDGFASVRNSPHLEIFRSKGIEVLLMYDRIDEWLVTALTEFDGKSLQSVAKGDLDLDLDDDKENADKEGNDNAPSDDYKELLEKVKSSLGEKVNEVRMSKRLTDSPACLVVDNQAMSGNLERMLREAGQNLPESRPHLELNPDHALVKQLTSVTDPDRLNDWAALLFDQAILAEGGSLDDPASFVKRLNELLLSGARTD